MPQITPFRSIRPNPILASRIAALPYDVYNRKEALAEVEREPRSFLRIDRAETQFPEDVDLYDERVYQKARELLERSVADGSFIMEEKPYYYIYELTMNGRTQTGIAACSSIDDYIGGVIRKHENTRQDKELDRIRHVDVTNANTGPIFLAYRSRNEINEIVNAQKKRTPLYDFISRDGIGHRVWRIERGEIIQRLQSLFEEIPCTYIADGHHRCASAVKVGLKRRREHPGYTGEEEFNRFLSVLFPDDQLEILPYNRVVKDLNGHTVEEFLKAVERAHFRLSPPRREGISPQRKGTFGMFLKGGWYLLTAEDSLFCDDPVKGLDVSVLQDHLLGPVLGIGDPRTDNRIDFVGGIRGLGELERRASGDMEIAFSLYPTSIQELLRVADAGMMMPPKSTWFEPKLRSGLFIHSLEEWN
jgi:uncharacterized protein (DUF1015 family)